ncbi:hypothetical protein [Mesorhizobium sp. M0047]|uniref:hypothetical protein n=1 Tax=Mesorhizobium sp. M0047 TaxID=2956859 RepID=UPI0033398965
MQNLAVNLRIGPETDILVEDLNVVLEELRAAAEEVVQCPSVAIRRFRKQAAAGRRHRRQRWRSRLRG